MAKQFRQLFEQIDVIVTPTEPITVGKHGATHIRAGGQDESVLPASWRLAFPFKPMGPPAITVVCEFHEDMMPIGL